MKQKSGNALNGLYVLTVLSLFLPWFTHDASIMGYCWGHQFLPFFLIPYCISGLALFRFGSNLFWRLLCLVSSVADVGILIYILGYWQKYRNIRDGFQLMDGLHTAQAGFWLAVFLHTASLLFVSLSLFSRKGIQEVSK